MADIFNRHNINRVFLLIVLTSFTMTYAVPLPPVEFQVGINEIAFMVRLEKLVEKLVKSESKGPDRMINVLVKIKNEIETTCSVSLDVTRCLDQIGNDLNKLGHKTPKKELEVIKKKLRKEEKNINTTPNILVR